MTHITLVKRDDGWMLFEGNADGVVLDGPFSNKNKAKMITKSYVKNDHYDEARIYTASGKLQERFGSKRTGDNITHVSELRPGDRVTPTSGPKYGGKYIVDEVSDNEVLLQRLDRGRRRDEYMRLSGKLPDNYSVYTTDQSRGYWNDYEKEGGYRIM